MSDYDDINLHSNFLTKLSETAELRQAGGLGNRPPGGGQQGQPGKTIADVKVAAKARALGRDISDK